MLSLIYAKKYTRDIRDIHYFIDHVYDLDARVDVIKKLGYKVGYDIANEDSTVGNIIKGKKGELRLQITPVIKSFPLVNCVILE